MNRFAVFVFAASACLSALNGQESNPEKKPPPASPPLAGNLKGTAETGAADSPLPVVEEIQKPLKKIEIGGTVVDLLLSAKAAPKPTAAGRAARKIRGWQLLNPFAPLEKTSKPPRDWTGRRNAGGKSQNPKTAEMEGINLFFIKF